jgi:glycosyltransferase involved in cell wall biosynthesis
MPRLVVAMPAFNAEHTIGVAIRSTLRALPADSELVVYDDNSTDNTLAVLNQVSDPRLRIIEGGVNVGGGAARNVLLDSTDSEIFASMDSDDICLPWRFNVQMRALEYLDICFGNAVRFGNGLPRPALPLSLRPDESAVALLFHNPFFHPTLFARRSILARGYSEARVAQDYEFWLTLAARGSKIGRTWKPLIFYRESPDQVSASPGYRDQVLSEPSLRIAYSHLLVNVTGNTIESVSSSPNPMESLRACLDAHLTTFRPATRAWYRAAMKKNVLLTPIG